MRNPFRYSYKAESIIDASQEIVWKVLVDLNSYHQWNPFTPKIETDWAIGHKVVLTVQMKNAKKPIVQIEYLRKLEPPQLITWGMNWGIFLKAERVQQLTKISPNRTTYFTEDIISGILAPVVHLMYGKVIQRGFERMALSLKTYTEKS